MLTFIEVLTDLAVTRWPLKSLIIGPTVQRYDWWCEHSMKLCHNLPYLECVSILDCYEGSVARGLSLWGRADRLFSHEDIFPRLEQVKIRCDEVFPGLRYNFYSWKGKRESTSLLYALQKVGTLIYSTYKYKWY